MLFIPADCPVCMEEQTGPPTVALPCGHVVCTQDFQRLGGRIGSIIDASAIHNNNNTTTTTTDENNNDGRRPVFGPAPPPPRPTSTTTTTDPTNVTNPEAVLEFLFHQGGLGTFMPGFPGYNYDYYDDDYDDEDDDDDDDDYDDDYDNDDNYEQPPNDEENGYYPQGLNRHHLHHHPDQDVDSTTTDPDMPELQPQSTTLPPNPVTSIPQDSSEEDTPNLIHLESNIGTKKNNR